MSDPGSTKRRSSGRSKSGCLTCRAKRVKCDENLPSCRRCERLKLVCELPCSRQLPSLCDRRRGVRSVRSRSTEAWPHRSIIPASVTSPSPSSGLANSDDQEDSLLGLGNQLERSLVDTATGSDLGYKVSAGQTFDSHQLSEVDSQWLHPYPQSFTPLPSQSSVPTQFMFPLQGRITESVYIGGSTLTNAETLAVTYFRTHFSLSQTTRDPEWSTPAMMLDHAVNNSEMLLHLILSVSLYDLQSRGQMLSLLDGTAQTHYEKGAQCLAEALQSECFSDHNAVLSSLYCVYAYMPRQKYISTVKIDRLSSTATEYIRNRRLGILFMTPKQSSATTQSPSAACVRAEHSTIARLIMWLFKMDAQCCFVGCKPCLLEYFDSRKSLREAIQASSRLALQLHWGAKYPISQSIRDIESTVSMDMMTDLLAISYRISALSSSASTSEEHISYEDVAKELDLIEVKYNPIFYYGSSPMTLQPAMKLNCATSATLFYATRIYLLRSQSHAHQQFGSSQSFNIINALGQLLPFAKHVCAGGPPQPVYEFQWSLFIASLETNDEIHQEWLRERICDVRVKAALEIALKEKREEGCISLSSVRGSFEASSEVYNATSILFSLSQLLAETGEYDHRFRSRHKHHFIYARLKHLTSGHVNSKGIDFQSTNIADSPRSILNTDLTANTCSSEANELLVPSKISGEVVPRNIRPTPISSSKA